MNHSRVLFWSVLCLAVLPHVGQAEAVDSASPEKVVSKDQQGRITRVQQGADITSFTYDLSGTLRSKESSRFGTTEYTYVESQPSGPFARVQSVRQVNERGSWGRYLVYDRSGYLALQLDGISDNGLTRILERLEPFFWPEGLVDHRFGALGPVEGNDFASITVGHEEDGTEVQRSRAFGQALEIKTQSLGAGTLRVRDSAGGERTEIWSEGSLLKAYDEHGSILEVQLDAFGRPDRITVGGTLVLWFDFEGGSRKWSRRHATNRDAENLIGSWRLADDFEGIEEAPLPRRTALAFLPGSVPIAEWDSELSPEGNIMIARRGVPYALIPFDNGEEVWRSISTSFRDVVDQDRIDYTPSKIRIHLSLGPASAAAGSEVSIVIERDREFVDAVGLEAR